MQTPQLYEYTEQEQIQQSLNNETHQIREL